MHKKVLMILFLGMVGLSNYVLWALPSSAGVFVETAWVSGYNAQGTGNDQALAIAVDASGNVYVGGRSDGSGTGDDYATVKYYPNGDTAWARRYNGPGGDNDGIRAIAVDDAGNVYVTGYSGGIATGNDYATIKYYPNGDTAWVRRYNGAETGSDHAWDIAVDGSGNVYVTGEADAHYTTIKYYPEGDTAWVRKYDGPGTQYGDCAKAIAVDESGNVYVTGDSWSDQSGSDYATLKYDASGNELWARRYNGPNDSRDLAVAIAVDNSGNVCVTGESYGIGAQPDYATIKYYPNGDTAWVRRYDGPANDVDYAYALAVDDSGNVYVTGEAYAGTETYEDYTTIKYYPNGDTAWVRRFDGPGGSIDWAYDLAVDGSGNVYVTGLSGTAGTPSDYATVSYDSEGNQMWARTYNGEGNYEDYAYAIALDASGNVYVAGSSFQSSTYPNNLDYTTIKYSQFSHGDVNGDGTVDIADIIQLINYLFIGGSAPDPLENADANCDEVVDVADAVHLINYLFIGGSPPSC